MALSRRSLLIACSGLPAGGAIAADLVGLIASMKPSICAIGTFSALASPRFTFRGSGFFVGNGSLVATCWHVLPEASADGSTARSSLAVLVPDSNGKTEVFEAEMVQGQRGHDLAVLRVKGYTGPPVNLAAAGSAREGMEVALMGFPIAGALGFRAVTHRGIVASIVTSALPAQSARQLKEDAVSRLRDGSFELLQLDATAYPGNSGGPLFDAETRQVVGVVNMVLVKGNRESALSHPTGITYAVPVRYLRDLLGRS